jgi:hypothetical protein
LVTISLTCKNHRDTKEVSKAGDGNGFILWITKLGARIERQARAVLSMRRATPNSADKKGSALLDLQ